MSTAGTPRCSSSGCSNDAQEEGLCLGHAVQMMKAKVAPEKFRVHLMDKKGRATCGEDGSEDPIEGKVERTTKLADVTCPFCMPTKCPHGKSLIACLDCWVEQDQAKAAADPRSGDDRRAPSVTVHLSKMSPLGAVLSACGLVSPLAVGHLFGRTIDGVDEVTCEDCKNIVPAENKPDMVNSPAHYGGKDNPYEAIKVIRAWGYDKNFCIGSVLKYLARSGKKQGEPPLRDLEKAAWYLRDEINAIKDREATK